MLHDAEVAEIVVVADGNPDAVRTLLHEFVGDRRVEIVTGPGRGAAWARQRGAEVSTSPVMLFLDDDVLPSPGLAAAHARWHRGRTDLVVMGFMPVGHDFLTSATARIYAHDYLAACRALDDDPERVLTDLWAGNMSISRAVIERVPLVDPESPCRRREDQDFGLRCLRAGLVGVFDRTLTAEHQFERSLDQFLATAHEQAQELAWLRAQYPELGDHDAGAQPVPNLVAKLRVLARVPGCGRAVRGTARVGVTVAGRVGADRWEDHGVALLRTLAQDRSAG